MRERDEREGGGRGGRGGGAGDVMVIELFEYSKTESALGKVNRQCLARSLSLSFCLSHKTLTKVTTFPAGSVTQYPRVRAHAKLRKVNECRGVPCSSARARMNEREALSVLIFAKYVEGIMKETDGIPRERPPLCVCVCVCMLCHE